MDRREFAKGIVGAGVIGVGAAAMASKTAAALAGVKPTPVDADPPLLTVEERWRAAKRKRAEFVANTVNRAGDLWTKTFVNQVESSLFKDVRAYLVEHGLSFTEHTFDGVPIICYKNAVWASWPESAGILL